MRRGTVRAADDTSYLDKRIRGLSNRIKAVEAGGVSEGGTTDIARLEALEARLERLEEGRLELARKVQGRFLAIEGKINRLNDAVAKLQAEE